jgi:trans-aconitate 2-methyltransferase
VTTGHSDWSPEAYDRFRGLRLRPALDLLAQVGTLPDGAVADLGCGSGAVGPALAARFPERARIGVDMSPAMLATAAATGAYDQLITADVATWQAAEPTALIFSNAALHWVGNHGALFPRLASMLVPGGMLAVQMPRQHQAPSHRFLRDFAASLFPDKFDFAGWDAPVRAATTYWQMLAPLGEVTAWETDYVQRLDPAPGTHPVRRFTESTAMRPFLDKLTETEAATFVHRYEVALASAYPLMADGSVLFPFRRVFFTLKV